ncbi:hypothetical protein DH2020_031010 [Rehmannia glutinosa]|uniref:Hydroxyproline-rich glycoprotein family protein n=1 Tax=Rehmannia glutinosa TaxID=99300 RepID=A0ABR0VJ67_REHGL
MSSVRNSVETVNAAATAIVTAERRAQPSTVQKRRWASCWSLYSCFGSYKHSKRIGHAVLVSQPTPQVSVAPFVDNNPNRSATFLLPFIAPPSSPASFLQSDPPSATHSPVGLLSLPSLSVHTFSPGGTAPIFTIGPYAYETQLVSPPVFSTFTTEPSTASFTPPPEPVQVTTPSSPEVSFAQLLSSSLAQNRRNRWTNIKSPGSAISTSGTSSPFPDKRAIIEFCVGEGSKFIGYEHFLNYKWGSRVGSGSLTPNGGISRLGSGSLTPNGLEPLSRDCNLLESQISEVASLANSDEESRNDDGVVEHRVSFELIGEDIPTCVVKETVRSPEIALDTNQKDLMTKNEDSCRENNNAKNVNAIPGFDQKHRTVSMGSSKDFNFNNSKEEVTDKSTVDCEWWINDKVVVKELGPHNSWNFFPMLQSGVS